MQTYISAKRQYRYDVYSPSTAPSYGSVPCDTTNNLSEFSQRKSSIFTYVKNYETILNEKGARISWSNLVDDSILYPFRFHDEVDTIRSPNKQSLPIWWWQTSYWTMDTWIDKVGAFHNYLNRIEGIGINYDDMTTTNLYGVRPMIMISKSEF